MASNEALRGGRSADIVPIGGITVKRIDICLSQFTLTVLAASLVAGSATRSRAQAAPQFPYVAYIVESKALVRSGPAERFYATGELPRGTAVEVYRHDGAGWCAVRPP